MSRGANCEASNDGLPKLPTAVVGTNRTGRDGAGHVTSLAGAENLGHAHAQNGVLRGVGAGRTVGYAGRTDRTVFGCRRRGRLPLSIEYVLHVQSIQQ